MKKLIHKLYGGLRFTWPRLIAYAVGAAALTAVFLIFPLRHFIGWAYTSRPGSF